MDQQGQRVHLCRKLKAVWLANFKSQSLGLESCNPVHLVAEIGSVKAQVLKPHSENMVEFVPGWNDSVL